MAAEGHASSRQVIFVGGTSYSGSTMIDMILAHGPGGFSCGEVAAIFQPYRTRHVHYQQHAGPASLIPWERLIAAGPDDFYSTIFSEVPNVQRIIDSSKDPMWIARRSKALARQGIATRNVLIWKTPAEFYQSRKKRARDRNWERAWINYHRHYFRHIQGFASISYKALVTEPEALIKLCRYLRIPYFSGKHEYWRWDYQTLFGNRSAKRHLSDVTTNDFGDDDEDIATLGIIDSSARSDGRHREIYYEPADSRLDELAGRNKCAPYLLYLRDGEKQLMTSTAGAAEPPAKLRASQMTVTLRKIKRAAVSTIVRTITPAVKQI